MKRAGVIGWPLKTSLSPIFQQAALDAVGLAVQFEPMPTSLDELQVRLDELRADDCVGACVTIPHKQNVMAHLDEVEQSAREIGAVNWIVNRAGKLHGYNTDGEGFIVALREQFDFECAGKRVLMFGAGGAARAVLYALKAHGAHSAFIVNRTPSAADALAKRFESENFAIGTASSLSSALTAQGKDFDLLVNTSAIGMVGEAQSARLPIDGFAELITNRPIVYDLVYSPPQTPFMLALAQVTDTVANGISMLIQQGALGFRLMFGKPAPVEVMFEALREYAGE